jgi:hypothetical protein
MEQGVDVLASLLGRFAELFEWHYDWVVSGYSISISVRSSA